MSSLIHFGASFDLTSNASTLFFVTRAMQLDPSDTMGVYWLHTDAAATGLASIIQEEAPVNVFAALQKESVQENVDESRKRSLWISIDPLI